MISGLPILQCPRRDVAEPSANPQLWRELKAASFHEAVTGAAPKWPTRVRTSWSERDWHVYFECEDPEPWATLTARDAPLFQEETVEVFVDPVGDLESYYEIETNPLGALLDIVFRKSRSGYKGDWAWNCEGLRSIVTRTAAGWSAELAIPFESIASPPRVGTKWRANFCRIERPARDGSVPRELTAWSPPLRESFHTPERFGIIEFVGENV